MIILVCGLGACSRSKMANYYVLTPRAANAAPQEGGPAIGIGPVVLPKYVDRINIVTTAGPQRLLLNEQNVWAEPLDENVMRVLGENLAALLGTERVHFDPWPHGAVEYRVGVTVVHLTGTLGAEARLDALWTVRKEGDETILAARRTNLHHPAGDDYDAYAAAVSDMLAELSREIAQAIPR
jgi:uncharacterized lipoprotein YmbA